jgi:hypothetical protein
MAWFCMPKKEADSYLLLASHRVVASALPL